MILSNRIHVCWTSLGCWAAPRRRVVRLRRMQGPAGEEAEQMDVDLPSEVKPSPVLHFWTSAAEEVRLRGF